MIEQQWQHQQFRRRTDGVEPCRPWRIRPQRSNHRERKQRNRKAQIGRFSDCRKTFTSINGTIERMNTAAKIATSVVDQGSETAIKMTKISAVAAQATGSRHRLASNAATDSLATALTPCPRARDRQARSC